MSIKITRFWDKVDGVVRGRGKKADKAKVEQQLDRLLDITICPRTIVLCHEEGSGCRNHETCMQKANSVTCNCSLASKIPPLELLWLRSQRTKEGEKAIYQMTSGDQEETARSLKAEKRKFDFLKVELKNKSRD